MMNPSNILRTGYASQHKPCSRTSIKYIKILFPFIWLLVFLVACNDRKKEPPAMFEALSSGSTGIDFVNKLTPTPQFNMFKYMYFYNGAGVGVGDYNNDGMIDVFFSSNQGDNKIY